MKEYVLGIDIGGTNTVYALVDNQGKIIYKNRLITTDYDNFISLSEALYKIISLITEKDSTLILKAIGVGAPNGNYYTGSIEFAPNLIWKDKIPVCKILEKQFKVPAVITNDANAAAYGEWVFGEAKDMRDFAVITLGTGVGSGIFVNGELLLGRYGFGGEFGHIIVEEQGRVCGCGKLGCLETYASVTGIKRTVLELLATFEQDSLLRNRRDLSGKKIEEAALKGDAIALKAFEITGSYLGKALANYITVFDPEAIFLLGGLALAGDLIFNPTRYHMEENLMKIFKGKVKLLPSKLSDNDAAIVGAAALATTILPPSKKVKVERLKWKG